MRGANGSEGFPKIAALCSNLLRGFGAGMDLDRGESHGAAQGIAQEGTGVKGFAGGRWPGVHDVGASHARGDREAGSETFAQADNVGNHPGMLAREQAAGAVEAGEYLVGNEQDFFLVADSAQQGQEIAGWWNDAAAA